ncbi:hypothetical protein G4D82_03095 [Flavobacterium sp. CYK-4]|uniref:hypothetical protein n=1 Tax=Flavobacterium lotistagni TaxID=2709660 RepID=UPI00140D8F9A|nr:hypothetical protein [Flavobacterium lotistagni]NHM06195.1 hypothetical protein [Flavobacterium lotistagni]
MSQFTTIKLLWSGWAFLAFSTVALAQSEFLNPSNSIAPQGSGLSTPKVFKPSVFSPSAKPNNNNNSSILEDKKLQFVKNNQFANPGDSYKEKLNNNLKEGGQDNKIFRKNEYFGEFIIKADHVKITYRDFGEVDGDQIKLLVNGREMVTDITLLGEFRTFTLGLEKGFNKVEYEAINEGFSVPNTAEFQIFDDEGQLITAGQWYLATGFRAQFMLIRE